MKNFLFHFGMPRRSGRYPWGSGKRPYQRSGEKSVATLLDKMGSEEPKQQLHLPKKEYGKVYHILATEATPKERFDTGIIKRTIGDYVYTAFYNDGDPIIVGKEKAKNVHTGE